MALSGQDFVLSIDPKTAATGTSLEIMVHGKSGIIRGFVYDPQSELPRSMAGSRV